MHPGYAFEDHDEPELDAPSFADRGVVRRHTARRAVSCDSCPTGRGIQLGERYAVHVGLDEGRSFFCERFCDGMPDACRAALPPLPAASAPRGPAVPFDPDNIPF